MTVERITSDKPPAPPAAKTTPEPAIELVAEVAPRVFAKRRRSQPI